ncbi:MAG TPA: type 4a pilus biogenesis protein PilO [bacterium]|nr:type 4a pilus biogenesis protein PilO [bacterium]
MAISEREKRLLIITLAIAVPGILYIAWSFLSQPDSSSGFSEATNERFEDLFAKIRNVESQKNRNRQLGTKLGNPAGTFIKESEVSKFMAEIEQIAGRSGLQIKSWSPSLNKRAKPIPTLELKVSITCPFDRLIAFLRNLRGAKYYSQPTSLKAGLKDPNQPDLDVSLTLTTYLIESQPEPAGPVQAIVKG